MAEATGEAEGSAYDHLLHVLGNALDLRDDHTAGHSRRVASYCLEIGRAVGCSEEQLRQIAQGAYVHDIGKIAIPDVILRKPGQLIPEEFEVLKTHTWIGYNMLSGVPSLAVVADMILAHHERWDGRGYPRGLKGEEIPVESRVFAIADALDAMTTDRPYRKALPFSTARAEINRESGKQFDPKIAETFLAIAEDVFQGIVTRTKRRTLRLPLSTNVTCAAATEGAAEARILPAVDISEEGMLLGNALGVELNTILYLRFSLPEVPNPLVAEGKVVRKELPARIAVAFVNTSFEAQEAIRDFIAKRVEA